MQIILIFNFRLKFYSGTTKQFSHFQACLFHAIVLHKSDLAIPSALCTDPNQTAPICYRRLQRTELISDLHRRGNGQRTRCGDAHRVAYIYIRAYFWRGFVPPDPRSFVRRSRGGASYAQKQPNSGPLRFLAIFDLSAPHKAPLSQERICATGNQWRCHLLNARKCGASVAVLKGSPLFLTPSDFPVRSFSTETDCGF